MGLKLTARVSEQPLNADALARRLAEAFSAREIDRAFLESVYAVVPDAAFGFSTDAQKGAEGKPTFDAYLAALPYRALDEATGEIVIQRDGLKAAAAALERATHLDAQMLREAKAKVRGALKAIGESVPDALAEAKRTVTVAGVKSEGSGNGKPLTEMVKGSVEYLLREIREAFDAAFSLPRSPWSDSGTWCPWHIEDTFIEQGFLAVRSWGDMAPDEFWAVKFVKQGDKFVFASRDAWELIELVYRPASQGAGVGGQGTDEARMDEGAGGQSDSQLVGSSDGHGASTVPAVPLNAANGAVTNERSKIDMAANGKPLNESVNPSGSAQPAVAAPPLSARRKGGKRLVETIEGGVTLDESANKNENGPWKVKGIGITAGKVNGNERRYSAEVLREAVEEAKTHLRESFGQGKLIRVLGEPEHPEDKATRRPTLLETVVNWTDISFDGTHVLLEGLLLATQQGKDIRAQMAGGVFPDISQRSRGESHIVNENGTRVEEVDWCVITGYDLVASGQGSDPDAGVTFTEARSDGGLETGALNEQIQSSGDEEMDPEKFKQLLKDNPQLLQEAMNGLMNADEMAKTLREKLGVAEGVNLTEAIKQIHDAQKELNEAKRAKAVADAIVEATKDLTYGASLNETFRTELAALNAESPEKVKELAESMKKRYDAVMAQTKLARMGFSGGMHVAGPVIETEAGVPEFAKVAFQMNERLAERGYAPRRDFRKPKTINEEFAALVLKRFDAMYGAQMFNEAKRFDEAEQTSDLSLPYSVSRAIVAEVFPRLIAASVFDFGVIETSPTMLFFEKYAAETGLTADSDAPESVVADLGAWKDLEHQRIIPDTVVVKDQTDVTTYDEDDDYIIDYYNGKIWAITGGAIGDGDTLHVEYDFEAIRKGEMQKIERMKGKLESKTITAKADRLATQISSEAIVFSRSQVGWDAVTRTLNMLINEIRRKIDKDLLFLALASVRSVASNSGGTWNVTNDPLSDAVKYFGAAKQKVLDRRYEPTGIILSTTNAEALSNWIGFTAAGKFPDSDLNAEGFIGRLKGKPVFTTTEFTDKYGLVVNRELVAYRVMQPMTMKGPYPSYEDGQLVAADQYYAEEYNAADSPLTDKGSYVRIV